MRLEGIQLAKVAEISDGEPIWLTAVKDSNAVQVRFIEGGGLFQVGPRGAITELSPNSTEPKESKKSRSDFLPLSER